MNHSPSHPYPQVFLVDRSGPQLPMMDPGLVPCWSFPPAVAKRKKRGWEEACTAAVLVFILFLILGALGLGAFWILRLQTELVQLRKVSLVGNGAMVRDVWQVCSSSETGFQHENLHLLLSDIVHLGTLISEFSAICLASSPCSE